DGEQGHDRNDRRDGEGGTRARGERVRDEEQECAQLVGEARDEADADRRIEHLLGQAQLLARHDAQPERRVRGHAPHDDVDLVGGEAELLVDLADLLPLVVGHVLDLPGLAGDLGLEEGALGLGGDEGPDPHGDRPGDGGGDAAEGDGAHVAQGGGHAGQEADGRDHPVVQAEDDLAHEAALGGVPGLVVEALERLGEVVQGPGLVKLLAAQGIAAGSVNTTYLLGSARGKHLLRVDGVKGELEVKRELDLLLFLRKHGFPCPQPIADRKGRHYREAGGKCLSVYRYYDGHVLRAERISAAQLENIGRMLADLHTIGKSYKKGIENRFSFERVASLYGEVRGRLPTYFKRIVRTLDDEVD